METSENISAIFALVLTSFSQGTTEKVRFSAGEYAQVREVLEAAYRSDVQFRNHPYQSSGDMSRALDGCAKWLSDPSKKAGLLVMGNVGNGKTTLARAINETVRRIRDIAKAEQDKVRMSGEYKNKLIKTEYDSLVKIPQPRISTALEISKLAGEDAQTSKDLLGKYQNPGTLMIVDDLGCEPSVIKVYGTETTPVCDLICKRYDSLSPTVITTNLNYPEIEKYYGKRIADRLVELCEIIVIKNNSYRK